MPLPQSKLARNIMKDLYIFELEGIKDDYIEKDIENAMLEKIKNVLFKLGKGFSFVESQYKISTENQDYYIDLLFYHLELRCYIIVELKIQKLNQNKFLYYNSFNFCEDMII